MKKIMRSCKLLLYCMLFAEAAAAQQIDSVEYYFNSDPGFGNGIGVASTDAPDISNLSFNVDITSLNKGFNNLYVRSHSSNGRWSLSQRWLFFKDIVPATDVTRVEYYIDTDPGFGNGSAVGISPSGNIVNFFFTVDITAQTRGLHTIFIRSLDNNGNWSVTGRWLFFKDMAPATTINRLEYFVDTDPGFGSGTSVTITPGANVSDAFFTVDITALTNGAHQLLLRSKDNNGSWSITNRWLFFKDLIPSATINRLEYFVDTDPGFGNGSTVTISPAANISNTFFTVDVTGLSNGMHTVFLRSKDNNGSWSITNRWLFFKDIVPAANVSKMEYYIDTDPGFGSGTDIPVIAGADLTDIAVPVNTTALTEGFHKIFIRSRDNNGSWSVTNRFGFFKEFVKEPLNVKAGEYFFDTDPGFGNGTVIPFTNPKPANIADFSFNANISPLTNQAPHYMFVRVLDSMDRWSLTNVIQFTKDVVVPVTWLSFNAKADNKVVLLDWKTATEQNSSHFEVERSINGISFEKIGSVKAAGNSNTITSYNFIDRLPVKGMNYYRLKQVDLDGKYSYSEIRKVEIRTELPLFVLYNNPSDGKGIIVKTAVVPSMLGVFDISGKKLRDITISSNPQQLDLSALPSGTYTAVLYNAGAVIAAEKLVIRH